MSAGVFRCGGDNAPGRFIDDLSLLDKLGFGRCGHRRGGYNLLPQYLQNLASASWPSAAQSGQA